MPSNNSKYTEEFREQTVKHIFETGKSATRMAEEMGIDTNTVCRWVRDYRRKHNLPTWFERRICRRNTGEPCVCRADYPHRQELQHQLFIIRLGEGQFHPGAGIRDRRKSRYIPEILGDYPYP